MAKKLILSLVFGIVFLASLIFVSAGCGDYGDVNDSALKYCDGNGNWQDQIPDYDSTNCMNDFECVNLSCVEDLCQPRYPDVNKTAFDISYFWNWITGVACDPLDTSYHCKDGTQEAFLCGVNSVLEGKGNIDGVCGYRSGNNNGGSNNGGSSSGVYIKVYSPENNKTYSYNEIVLHVSDLSKTLKYWKYKINNGAKISFAPGRVVSFPEGKIELLVEGSSTNSFSSSFSKSVSFTVDSDVVTDSNCGNGIVDAGEECDNGVDNSNREPDACRQDCALPRCGDGVCDSDESSNTCSNDCKAAPRTSYEWLFWLIVGILILLIIIVTILIIFRATKKDNKSSSNSSKPSNSGGPGSGSQRPRNIPLRSPANRPMSSASKKQMSSQVRKKSV